MAHRKIKTLTKKALEGILKEKMDAAIAFGKAQLDAMRVQFPGKRESFTLNVLAMAEVQALTLTQCEAIIGAKLGEPRKMPGFSFGTPAKECVTGTELRDAVGSVCEFCYAYEEGNYRWAAVIAAAYRRLLAIETYTAGGNPLFPYALARVISERSAAFKNHDGTVGTDVFRWHDAGDLQSLGYLQTICLVAELTPHIRHWIPTREMPFLMQFNRAGLQFPPNLQVNFSVHKRNAAIPNIASYRDIGLNVGFSFVLDDGNRARYDDAPTVEGFDLHYCPSLQQDGKCLDCRACWGASTTSTEPKERSTRQPLIVYGFH